MDKNKIYHLKNNKVIMEHLSNNYTGKRNASGQLIDNIQSEGLYLFDGEMGKMKPVKSLTISKAEIMIKEIGLK